MPKNCPRGKVVNPATGRCVFKDSPVLKKTLKPSKPSPMKIVQVKGPGPVGPVGPSKVLIKCGKDMYINPKTKRCVQLKNKDIQKLLKQGYTFSDPSGPSGPVIDKVPINDKDNKNDPGVKVLVPPDSDNMVKLVYCGPGKVINPVTGRCVLLSGPMGKKLTSVPYVIVNPPSGPQKVPYFKEPKKVPKLKGPLTSLDQDGDNYISVREYLDAVESKGPQEKSSVNFAFYNQRDLGILFILTLIKNQRGPIHKIGCIPLYHLCVYKNRNGTYYTMKNINIYGKLSCDRTAEFYEGSTVNTYASIIIFDAPMNTSKTSKDMTILTPPNLAELIRNCEKDNKYMVVSDLTLMQTDDPTQTSHANVLIFDTQRKTIERFDPHGGNEYSDVKLAYDTTINTDSYGRKDFMFGKNKFGLDKPGNDNLGKKKKSQALFNQFLIDNALKSKFIKILPDYKYYGTNETTPYLGPQIKADEYDGLCVTWSCMYIVLRLLNPQLSPAEVTLKMIDGTPNDLRNRILRFQKFIIKTLQKEKKFIK